MEDKKRKELVSKIETFKEQADIAYSNGLDSVGDIYTAKVRELEEELSRPHTVEEVQSDAPFRLKMFGSGCVQAIKEQEECHPINHRFNCIGCQRNCEVVVRPGYIGMNEDGMTIYFPTSDGGDTSDKS